MEIFLNITLNGLATGMLIFLLAAGLSLIFGLMSVLNFAHGGLFLWGAYAGVFTYIKTDHFVLGLAAAILTGIVLGFLLEQFIIKPVYGNHIQQILITLGAMLVLSECVKVAFGPNQVYAKVPDFLKGSFDVGGILVIKYRLFIIIIGLLVFSLLWFLLHHTKVGLYIRAGVMNKEMIEALGVNVKWLFLVVFLLGSAMAGLSGMLLGPYSGTIHAGIGLEYGILAFIVVIIGGMGSIKGTAIASLLVGVLGAYCAYYMPSLSLAVNMLFMFIILIFRPQGLLGEKEAVKV